MKRKNLWFFIVMIIFSLCLTVCLTACGDDNNGGNNGNKNEKSFTINCPTEMMAGDRIEITITKSSESLELYHDDYEWKIVGENTVGGSFEFEDLYKNDNYTNKFFRATTPGTVQIQAINTTSGTLTSNIVEITVKGYYINTVDELKAIANSRRGYVLANDIDLSSETNWKPIEGFKGTLSGGGYDIVNLTIDSVNGENLGLFGNLQGTVQNLKIENAKITARGDIGKAGIVAGTNSGKISSVIVSGNVATEYYSNVGGLVGYNNSGNIINCINQATVLGTNNVGGIVGNMIVNEKDAITGCQNEGIITGKENVGGISGYVTCAHKQEKNSTYTVSNNENKNTVAGTNNVGGIFGEVNGGSYKPSTYSSTYYGYFEMSVLTNTAEVTGSSTGNNVGGIIGKATRLNLLTTCDNKADVNGGTCVGGIVGYAPNTNIKATGIENNNTITGKGKVGGFAGHTGIIENAVNNGDIVSTGILIENEKSRAYVGGIAGYCTGVIGCENNSDIKVETNGAFVGGISGYVEISESDKVNNNINHGSITGKENVGGIAGYLTTFQQKSNSTYKVSNNENKNTIVGTSNVGGIFGEINGMEYRPNSYDKYYGYFEMSILTNTAEVTGSSTGNNVGGLIGKATRLNILTTCKNTANVTGCSYVGGFVGCAPDVNIKATGEENNSIITGKSYIGGFAGQAGIIENAVNNGEILSTAPNEKGDTYLGGIAGYCTGVIGCVNNADIEIINAGKYIGGIAGCVKVSASNKVNDNVNYGSIIGKANVGGISGYLTCTQEQRSNSTYIVSNNENKNTVVGTNNVAGIFGEVKGMEYRPNSYDKYYGYFEVINCANESNITGNAKIGGIVGAYTLLKTDSNIMDTNTTLYGEKLGQ